MFCTISETRCDNCVVILSNVNVNAQSALTYLLLLFVQSRDRGRGMFQHRSNIEKALAFLKKKSVNDTTEGAFPAFPFKTFGSHFIESTAFVLKDMFDVHEIGSKS